MLRTNSSLRWKALSAGRVDRTTPTTAVVVGLVLLLLVGITDYGAVPELSFAVFYLVPVCLVAWYVGNVAGTCLAGLSTLVWSSAEIYEAAPSHILFPLWNGAVRLGFFLVLAYTVSALKRALERETELARTDAVTGARNSRSFREALEGEIGRLRRYERPFTLVYLDVDEFKRVNDERGHSVGDELLHAIAAALRDCLRGSDTVARLGGDEFAVLLPETDAEAAADVLRKLERRLTDAMRSGGWPVTFSIGAATLLESPPSVDACLEAADNAMYGAKNQGKNRVMHEVLGRTGSATLS